MRAVAGEVWRLLGTLALFLVVVRAAWLAGHGDWLPVGALIAAALFGVAARLVLGLARPPVDRR